jgi:hypothetical protein
VTPESSDPDRTSQVEAAKYWFRAKRYGLGWGLPCAWQGWVVLLGYVGLLVAAVPFLQSGADVILYVSLVIVLTGLLIAICWKKGEPVRWRWGEKE